MMKPYLIADTTYNHEGSVEYLMQVIDELSMIGVDAVKFHLLFDLDDYMHRSHPSYTLIKRLLLQLDEWDSVLCYAKQKGLDVVALCDDTASMDFAVIDRHVDEIEIHSSGIVDEVLLKSLSGYQGKIMVGVGGASYDEIQHALGFFDGPVTLMYGFNGWPSRLDDVHIKRMIHTRERFGCPVGYADHTVWDHPYNEVVSCAAGFNGFPILEKHYTLHPGLERVDYRESIGKQQMIVIKEMMELACMMYGDETMSENEKMFASKIRKVDGLRR